MSKDIFFYDQLWHRIKSRIVNAQDRALVIYNGIKDVIDKGIAGDIAEIGCYKGGVIRLMAEVAANKTIYGFDTFEGFNKDLSKLHVDFDADFTGKLSNNSLEDVTEYLSDLKNAILIKGIFPGSIPDGFKKKRFCFVHIDCDIYKPTIDSLKFFYQRIEPNGWVVVDDYIRLPGVTRAVDEFFSDKKEKINIIAPLQASIRRL